VIAALALTWLATGMILLADDGRRRALGDWRWPRQSDKALRLVALGLAWAAARALGPALPAALVLPALALLAMVTFSTAVLLWPLAPRGYAASLPLSALALALAPLVAG
jgi:hypothetical protein